ncbi:MAG TPA: hypothetical protein VKV21_18780 [Solirubrobacteraceae bacterium]|nr:hypothetical protein [Solirubrobacteraceae bacterium]
MAAGCGGGSTHRGSGGAHDSTTRASTTPATTTGRSGSATKTAPARTTGATAPARSTGATAPARSTTTSAAPATVARPVALPLPRRLAPFRAIGAPSQGRWHAAGRRVAGRPAVEETTLLPPGGSQVAGLAWMDARLLAARLYSGSESPGGGPYRFTAPIEPAQARRLVAAFNGGFKMNAAQGGYLTERRTIEPLRRGAASLVIYAGGSVAIGAWGREVGMTRHVVAVRQNLVPLVDRGRLTALARSPDWQAWGATCGASSCASSVPGIEHQWRSGLGITADGALVYAEGPALSPAQLGALLVRAGAVRGMELDINPDWPIFATYDPPGGRGLASPANGHVLIPGVRGADTFFQAWWARDFVTMSARPDAQR